MHSLNVCQSDQGSASSGSSPKKSYEEELGQNISNTEDLKYSVCFIEVDSYFYDKENKFMIVKAIEEIENGEDD